MPAKPKANNIPTADELVWGAEAISKHLGRTTKGAFGALESSKVPGARNIVGRWALHLPTYYASFDHVRA